MVVFFQIGFTKSRFNLVILSRDHYNIKEPCDSEKNYRTDFGGERTWLIERLQTPKDISGLRLCQSQILQPS